MTQNNLQPLHVAIKQVLREAHAVRARSTAGVIAALALSATALSPQARAAEYTASTETQLYGAVESANDDADSTATITLTGNITLTSTTAFEALTKPITLDTNGFTLGGLSGSIPGGGFAFSGNALTIVGTGELRGGNTGNASIPNSGPPSGTAVSLANGSLTNRASISAGRGGDNANGPGGSGQIGISATNSTVTNDGAITGGRAGDKIAGAVGSAGVGGSGVSMSGGGLTNNGTITGGQGGDNLSGISSAGPGGTGALLSGGSHVNNGTIRGGQAGLVGGGGIGGGGVRLENATFVNNAGGLIEGGSGTSNSGGGVSASGNSTLTNHGTIRNGVFAINNGSNVTVTNTGTIEGNPGAAALNATPFQSASLTVINSGTLRAGTGQTNAIAFSSSAAATGILEVRAESVIEGNVSAPSSSVNDTLRLGGDLDSTFDLSRVGTQYTGFQIYEKTGASTWTLTGAPTSAIQQWFLNGGALSISSASQLPTVGFVFNGGTLRNTASFTSSRGANVAAGGGTFQTDADLTWSSSITGTGTLTKAGAARLVLTNSGNNWSGGTTIAAGTLQIGNGAFSGNLPAGNVLNNATLAFNRFGTLTYNGLISGTGEVIQRGMGVTVLTGNNTYAGATTIQSGTLRINGDQSAATGLVSVANGGTLGGSGIIGGAVTVADGGRIAPGNSPGTLTMGALTLSGGSILDFELGEANVASSTLNDLINVNGDLTLDGTLNVALSAGGTYGAGIYRLINYTGTLTDNGLELGLTPASSANYIQNSVANQVNLINTQGLVLNYWDAAPSARNDGQIAGGSGVWQAAGNDNWTTADGSINADYQDASMAIFGGSAGTITVDDSLGAIDVSGLQFASNGYRLEGDAINLSAGLNAVRVGDGTEAGAGFTATIASDLAGAGTLDKTDLGTLVLTGNNSYTGGTTISAGTLQLGDGGTSGSLTGDVTNGGAFIFNRSDAASFGGVISGNGTVALRGSGTMTITAAGSEATTLDVQSGTLELSSGASFGAQTIAVAPGATLRSGGALTGSAAADRFTLAGTFIGGAHLLDGDDQVLIIDGADYSQAAFDGGAGVDTLELTSTSTVTLQPALAAGFENLVKRGSGALTLAGTVDDFAERITVAEGTVNLQAANVQTTELRIDPGATLTGAGMLSGGVYNAGMLSPGNSPGVIYVGGNYIQDANGVLVSEILRTGTDLLDVGGTAALAGTHRIHVEYGLYLDGTTHTLIQAAGGITGDFASVEMNESALMTADRELTANAETVTFTRQPFTSIGDAQSGRGRFAAWLEEQITADQLSPEMTNYIDSLLQQPTTEGVQALLGERGEPVATVSQNNVSILGAGFARTVFDRFTLSDSVQCSPTQQVSNDSVSCFWANGLRQWGQAGGGSRYDWTSDGGQIGVDRSLSSSWAVGGTFGYADTNTRDLSGGHNEVRSKMGGLYASYAPGKLSLGAMAFYSGNENSTRRNVLIGSTQQHARADFDSDSYGAGIRLSYRVTDEAGPLVRPFIEAFYDHIEAAGFSERNAGDGNLSAHVHDRDGLRGTLGLQLADSFEGYGRVFRPALEVGVAHQFEDARSTIDLQPFSDAPSFRTYGPALDRTAYIARASLNVSLGANASMALGYGGEIADDYSQHEGNLSFRVAW